MDPDDTDAAWAQQELEERRQREDALIKQVRKATANFRTECDEFHADFTSSMRSITKGNEHGDFSN